MNGYNLSNEKIISIIAAACLGIAAIININWMVSEIQTFYGFGSFLWIMQYILTFVGCAIVGVTLFMQEWFMLMVIGTGILCAANLIGVFMDFYYIFAYGSLITAVWIFIWIINAGAWGMLLFAVMTKDRSVFPMLQLVVPIAVAFAFVLGIIMRIVGYNMGDYFEISFFALYWKAILYDLTIAAGLILVFFIILQRRGELPAFGTAKATQVVDRAPAQQPLRANRFCAQCGTRLDPDARFCENCGAPVRRYDGR